MRSFFDVDVGLSVSDPPEHAVRTRAQIPSSAASLDDSRFAAVRPRQSLPACIDDHLAYPRWVSGSLTTSSLSLEGSNLTTVSVLISFTQTMPPPSTLTA